MFSSIADRTRQGGQQQTLTSLYAADVQSTLDSQQRKHVAEIAELAAKKNACNDLFAGNSDLSETYLLLILLGWRLPVPEQSLGPVHALAGR